MNTHSLQLKAGRNAALLVVAAGFAFAAAAQPTGNPKGSAPPPTSDAQKAPASRPPTTGFGDRGKIVTDKGTVNSRSQTTNSPANVGPARSSSDKASTRTKDGSGGGQGGSAPAKPPP